jgi:hypothetical protein
MLKNLESSNKSVYMIRHLDYLCFYVLQIVTNFHLFGFYSLNVPQFIPGITQNWNSSGYLELTVTQRKYGVRCFAKSDTLSPSKCND